MTESGFTPEDLADLQAGNALAQRIHDELFKPGDVSMIVRIFAIASLATGTAAMYGDNVEGANKIIDLIEETARSSLQSAFDHLAHPARKQ